MKNENVSHPTIRKTLQEAAFEHIKQHFNVTNDQIKYVIEFGEIDDISRCTISEQALLTCGIQRVYEDFCAGYNAKDLQELMQLREEVERLRHDEFEWSNLQQNVAKLQAFKDYVHDRLDKMGVPVDPESPHKAAGCRIGGRIDFVESQSATIKELVEALEAVMACFPKEVLKDQMNEDYDLIETSLSKAKSFNSTVVQEENKE
jgi:hypothetical protein